jgi:hypothetical protein
MFSDSNVSDVIGKCAVQILAGPMGTWMFPWYHSSPPGKCRAIDVLTAAFQISPVHTSYYISTTQRRHMNTQLILSKISCATMVVGPVILTEDPHTLTANVTNFFSRSTWLTVFVRPAPSTEHIAARSMFLSLWQAYLLHYWGSEFKLRTCFYLWTLAATGMQNTHLKTSLCAINLLTPILKITAVFSSENSETHPFLEDVGRK